MIKQKKDKTSKALLKKIQNYCKHEQLYSTPDNTASCANCGKTF